MLSSCSGSGSSPPAEKTTQKPSRSFFRVIGDTVVGSVKGAFEAVQAPLEDVNLKRQSIPPNLQQMTGNPYALPNPMTCANVIDGIVQLDTVLGPEHVAGGPANDSLRKAWANAHHISWKDKDKYVDSGSSFIQDKVADEVRTHVDIIPYRSWLRWVSGADAHAKAVAKAYEAGKLHRAFLRGVAVNLHCDEQQVAAQDAKPVTTDKKAVAGEETALNDSASR